MKSSLFLFTSLCALVAALVHASSPVLPLPSTPASGSGMMVDNIPPNNNIPGGGIGSSSHMVNERALAKAVPDTYDSSTYHDAAAEKEAEELALALDAASENAAEDEGADENAKVKRRRESRGRRETGVCRKYTSAKCEKCQKEWESYQACLYKKNGSGVDVCVQDKRQNYVSARPFR